MSLDPVLGQDRNAQVDRNDAKRRLDEYMDNSDSPGWNPGADAIARESELKAELAQAEKGLNDARKTAAIQNSGTGAISKYFPGGLQRLRDTVQANPEDFGPKVRELSKSLNTIKAPEDIEQQKARAHSEQQEREHQDRMARFQEAGREKEEEEERAAEAQEREYQQKLASFKVQGDQKIAEENQAAMQGGDMLKARQKRIEEGQRTSQVITGHLGSFINQIQASIKGPDRNPTEQQNLTALRDIGAFCKRTAEAIERTKFNGPARAG